uniref:Uncharacterized protein n=1 Tax=Anopheles melas TaxID=34690 RepID=A0A182UEC8_9DIPT
MCRRTPHFHSTGPLHVLDVEVFVVRRPPSETPPLTNLGRAAQEVGRRRRQHAATDELLRHWSDTLLRQLTRVGTVLATAQYLPVEMFRLERDRIGVAGQLARLLVVVQLGPTGENWRSCRSPEISRVTKSGRRIGDSGTLYLSFLLSILSSCAAASGRLTGSTYLMLKSILVIGAGVVVVVVVVVV